MILLLFLGFISPNVILGQTVHNKVLNRGEPYMISNPRYPKSMEWKNATVEWNLQVENNGNIKFACSDIRMVQRSPWRKPCTHVYISITDGKKEKKVCGSGIFNFVYKSKGSNLKIKAVSSTEGSGSFQCTALNNAEPEPEEIVRFDDYVKAKRIKLFVEQDSPQPYLDKMWTFESPEGSKISFQCYVALTNVQPICGFDVLTFNNGIDNEEYCAGSNYIWFSKTNKAKLRFQLNNYGVGRVRCTVQSVTGPHPNEYDNVVSEEVDSSEHGITPGTRQTSCKCGWANKSGARIINGQETRVNEFPWMVHLLVRLDTGDSTCGASIITPRHVLTAAHCVVSKRRVIANPQEVQLILGKHDGRKPTGNEVKITGQQIFIPDAYLEKGPTFHDIAVILTRQKITFNDIIGPICIEPKSLPVINRHVTVMGWGLTEVYSASTYLKKAKIRVIDTAICGGNAWDVCTTTEPRNFCNGDSGGPLVSVDQQTNMYSQLSIVSRVPMLCRGFAPSYSTRVAYFYDWIQKIIRETDPSVTTCHKV